MRKMDLDEVHMSTQSLFEALHVIRVQIEEAKARLAESHMYDLQCALAMCDTMAVEVHLGLSFVDLKVFKPLTIKNLSKFPNARNAILMATPLFMLFALRLALIRTK